MMTHTAN